MRAVAALIGLVLLDAVLTRIVELAGLRTCGCADDCWCRRPGLNLVRWIVPVGHRALDPDQKAARAA